MAHEVDVADFLNAINNPLPDDNLRGCRGTVVAYDAGTETVTVTISGGSVEVPGMHFFDHYNPPVGDEVHIITMAESKMVFGKIRRP